MSRLVSRFGFTLCLAVFSTACGDDEKSSVVGLGDLVHVVPGGSAKGDGSEAHPFATLAEAAVAIEADTTWTGTLVAHEGRHEILEELALPASAEFKVLPGATFALGSEVSLHVQANMEIKGTEANPVTFTWLHEGMHWGSLTNFEKTSLDNVVEWATFEHGGESQFNGIGVRGALSFADAGGRVSHCTFRENEGDDGMNLKRSPTNVESCRFERNFGDALDSDGAADAEVHDCYFIDNGNDAVDLGEGSTEHIYRNIMLNSGDKGISIGDASYPWADHNLIVGCHIGIGIKDSSDPELRNNTLYGNEKGISSYENTAGLGGGKGQFVNGIIWNSTEIDIEIIDGSPSFSYSCIQSGYEGEGNLSESAGCADPMFMDPDNADLDKRDFHLMSAGGRFDPTTKKWVKDDATSPCVDVGDLNTPVQFETAPNGNRINLGAYGGTKEASRSTE